MRAKLVFDFTHFTNIFCISIKEAKESPLKKMEENDALLSFYI